MSYSLLELSDWCLCARSLITWFLSHSSSWLLGNTSSKTQQASRYKRCCMQCSSIQIIPVDSFFSCLHQPAFVRRLFMAPVASPLGPRPVVFCGPSGSGKSTLIKKLMNEFVDVFGFSVSHTTRKPRPGEVDGRDYHYVTREEMETGIQRGDFIESAEFSGNMYGTRYCKQHLFQT